MSLDFDLDILVDTGGGEPHRVCLYSSNITHNVHAMWDLAGCSDALYESDGKLAGEILAELQRGEANMRNALPEYRKLNPPNGWGDADGALQWLHEVIDACARHPKATVRISR